MAFHLIVTCVSQKTEKNSFSILDSSIEKGELENVYAQWERGVHFNDLKKKKAIDLYTGGLWGCYKDAWGIINGRVENAKLWVLSAGYGLISSEDEIVPYDITFQEPKNGVPSLLSKVELGPNGETRKDISQNWWQKLTSKRSIERLLQGIGKNDQALFVLGKDYLDAVFEDLFQGILSARYPENIAVICNNENDATAKKLNSNWLFANKRFVNLPGSNATFVNAKVAHKLLFKMFEQEGGLSWWSIESFNDYLKIVSSDLSDPKKYNRIPCTDDEVKEYIREELDKQDAPFSRLHRKYRDGGNACEYSRFRGLYGEVKEELKAESLTKRPKFPVEYTPRNTGMLYFLPDWDDRVDPLYDFVKDIPFKNRDPYSHDTYHYELFGQLNCDGILVSKSVLEANKEKIRSIKDKGIHKHLRLPDNVPVLADCGAFNYISEENPPYETEETLDFYQDLGFDYGVAIDHLILPGILKKTKHYHYDQNEWIEVDKETFALLQQDRVVTLLPNKRSLGEEDLYREATVLCKEVVVDEQERLRRYELTINNAREFIQRHKEGNYTFVPIGSVQGWDPESYAHAVSLYQEMGYEYIALGGLVRSTTGEIISILQEISKIRRSSTKLHVFGVARLEAIEQFKELGVASVDSAGALRQAWLSSSGNYHWPDGNHYTAIRIPPADKGAKVKKILEEGEVEHSELLKMELDCRQILRRYDAGKVELSEVMDTIMPYHLLMGGHPNFEKKYLRTLEDKPWKKCGCVICQDVGIEVVIFRRNNRNRRRGFHNTWVFHNRFKKLTEM